MPCKRGASSRMAPFSAAYCEQLVEFMGRGYSLTAFAGEIGVTRATLEAWREKHPTFARAVARGQARRARVLEDHLLAAKGATAFGAHMEALKTAAPDDWRGEGAARPKPPARVTSSVRLDLPDNGRDA